MARISLHAVEKLGFTEPTRRISTGTDRYPLFFRRLIVTSDKGELEIEFFSDDSGKLQIEDAGSEGA